MCPRHENRRNIKSPLCRSWPRRTSLQPSTKGGNRYAKQRMALVSSLGLRQPAHSDYQHAGVVHSKRSATLAESRTWIQPLTAAAPLHVSFWQTMAYPISISGLDSSKVAFEKRTACVGSKRPSPARSRCVTMTSCSLLTEPDSS